MSAYRLSDWTIRIGLTEHEEVWLHGYTGAIDVIGKNELVSPSSSVLNALVAKGYYTQLAPSAERAHFLSLCDRLSTRPIESRDFVLQLTRNCNFACTYCSQRQVHGRTRAGPSDRMSEETVAAVETAITQMSQTPTRDRVILFGGEPLLKENYDLVEDVIKVVRRCHIGTLEIITNGFFVDEVLLHRVEGLDTTFHVSVDGPPDIHDRRRRTKRKEPTYERVIANVARTLRSGSRVTLRINVDAMNYAHVPRLLEQLEENRFFDHTEFTVYVALVQDYGRYSTNMHAAQMYAAYVNTPVFRRLGVAPDPLGLSSLLAPAVMDGEDFPFTTNYCGANRGSMIMFSPAGLIFPCWDCHEPGESVGSVVPAFHWDEEAYDLHWLCRRVQNVAGCSSCKYALFCGGGCQYLAKRASGGYYAPHCGNFQETFDVVLKDLVLARLQQ